MIPIQNLIRDRLSQLENRKMMIPRYVERPGHFLGKKDFSLEDLPKIQEEISLCKAALKGIDQYLSHSAKPLNPKP